MWTLAILAAWIYSQYTKSNHQRQQQRQQHPLGYDKRGRKVIAVCRWLLWLVSLPRISSYFQRMTMIQSSAGRSTRMVSSSVAFVLNAAKGSSPLPSNNTTRRSLQPRAVPLSMSSTMVAEAEEALPQEGIPQWIASARVLAANLSKPMWEGARRGCGVCFGMRGTRHRGITMRGCGGGRRKRERGRGGGMPMRTTGVVRCYPMQCRIWATGWQTGEEEGATNGNKPREDTASGEETIKVFTS